MSSSTIPALATELDAVLRKVAGVVAVHVFGSALRTPAPDDVDLVAIYGSPLTPLTAPSVLVSVEEAVSKTFHLPAHVMFFSVVEAEQPGLLADLEGQIIFKAEGPV